VLKSLLSFSLHLFLAESILEPALQLELPLGARLSCTVVNLKEEVQYSLNLRLAAHQVFLSTQDLLGHEVVDIVFKMPHCIVDTRLLRE